MIARFRLIVVAMLAALAMLASLLPSVAMAAAEVTGHELVNSVRSGRTSFDYTYRITVRNGTPALASAQATVQSSAAGTQVLKGTVTLGDLADGATLTSTDVFTIRQDRSVAFNPAALTWVVSGSAATGPSSMELVLSEPFVAPDGSISVAPTVRDQSGAVLDNESFQFNLAVAPVGTVTGNAPIVNGLSVSFPKLEKRLLNQNFTIDPAGEYADGDPTDPNYGKETGGRYRITVSVEGSSLTASTEVMVLPSGTAGVTVKASRYAGQLQATLAAAALAARNADTAALAQARAALQAVDAEHDNSSVVLGTTQVLAPPNGYLVTPSLLSARGFVAGPQDAQFAGALSALSARIRAARAQVEATNVLALTQESIDALQAAADAYRQSLAALQGLQLSTLGAAQQEIALNQQVGSELPQLLDAIKRKSNEMLVSVTTSSLRPQVHMAGATHTPAGLPRLSPKAMYAGTRPVQLASFAPFAFSILTDLSGTARANIIELTVTLVNSLVNIMVADLINQNGPGGLSIDVCLASSSVAYVCPNYRPSVVTGSGFGRDASAVQVALVGCVGGDLIRNLMTLRQPRDIGAGIRLINKVVSITNSLQQDGGVGAIVTPDFIDVDDLFGGDRLYFANGWPRVNQGRLPCVGIVIVMNKATGGVSALNLNFLGQCG